MKKTAEEIRSRLDELATAKREKDSKWNKEIKEAKLKKSTAEAGLETAESPDEYKRLMSEKKEADDFLNLLMTQGKNDAPPISKEEYKQTSDELTDMINSLKSDYAPKLEKEVEKLLTLLEEYYQKGEALEDLRSKAQVLYCGHSNNGYEITTIADDCEDPLFYIHYLCGAFFYQRSKVARIARQITSPTAHNFKIAYSTEEAGIAKELERRMKRGK